MAKILLAWEMGGGYGHIDTVHQIGAGLRAAGHDIVYALKDLSRASVRAGGREAPVFAAPTALPTSGSDGAARSLSYADVLQRSGYRDPRGLGGLLRGWLWLFDAVAPDLVVCDHAPTAQLASRIAGVRCMAEGTGFCIPPPADPLPTIQPWAQVTAADLGRIDREVLDAVNAAVARFGGAPLDRLADLFDPQADILCTFPELDHYEGRADAEYAGAISSGSDVTDPPWADSPRPRVFAYLSPQYKGFEDAVAGLARAGLPTLLHAGGAAADAVRSRAGPSLRLSPQPVDMDWAMGHADLVVCNGGHGTASDALRAGLPLLILPGHLEQALLTYRLAQQGLAAVVDHRNVAPSMARGVRGLAADAGYRERAQGFAAQYGDHTSAVATAAIVDRCQAVLARPVAGGA